MFKLLIPIHRYHDVSFSPKKVETWKRGFIYYDGARERGGTGLLGMGRGGGDRTYRNRYLILDLIRCCQATNDEKPDLKSFPYCNLRENFMVDI